MKQLIVALLLVSSLATSAQSKTFYLAASCPQSILTTDSVYVSSQLSASDGYKSVSWIQKAGPNIRIPSPINQITPTYTISSLPLGNLPAGNYVFTATYTSITGVTGFIDAQVTVNPILRRIAYVLTVYTDSTRIINK